MLGHVLLKKEKKEKGAREDEFKTKASTENPLKVFISYSHKDEAFKSRFDTALKPLKRLELIDVWQDRLLLAGEKFEQSIFSEISKADIVCLLISPNFIESEYCFPKKWKQHLNNRRLLALW
ncbi:MAG: toll/interleukin-1 receptor domain-containing protein [Lewinellaceae bacterium]|nr:toll/interleukin-1 receptor domain-containing protein [Lewinellaceae bacterium]